MADFDDFGVGGIIAIVVAVLLAASLIPPAIGAATSTDFSQRTDLADLSEGESYNISATNLTVSLNDVNATNSEATFEFTDGDTATTESRTLSQNENASVSLDGVDYTVNATSVDTTDNTAILEIEWQSPDNGGVAQDLWYMIPLFMVLAIALFFVSFVTKGSGSTNI